ncbi:hypothetical protein M409DRAFT_68495 [Zasmidium cellare ATCC 36951]|uniref:Rhodopsin domain-containing protein n=1 Tax=Zasmidium cellare ATCC 36951 TaxID=1080233 RepID=A0A6A6C8T7_ZASCE|nr:uncharacterized protein M409DRAFT_68495 [Zasmidium cellare ATCC 36951]KAF2163597.1 hypothetical protein M409DRAFT_68495 [Zasmidium cellare ATCC 36951]
MTNRDLREHVDNNVSLSTEPASPTAAHFGAGDVGWTALGPAIAFSVLATIVVVLRWYTRSRLVRIIGLDDYVILLSLILAWVQSGLIAAAVYDGVGSYNSNAAPADTIMIAKLIVAVNSVWAVTVNITKASILVQYLRVVNGQKTRMCCWLLMATLLPATLWGVFGGIFLCNPTAKLFDPQIPGHCRSAQTYWVSVAAVNIGLDFLTLLLTIPSISGLHLPRKQKLLTMLVFLLGFIVCLVSVTRLATVLITSANGDYIMSGIWAIIWSAVEANVGIICASLLALKCLVVKMFPGAREDNELPSHCVRIPEISMSSSEPEWTSRGSQVPTLGDRESSSSWLEAMSLTKSSQIC